MSPNPLDHLRRRDTEHEFRKNGWGPPRSWPVPRADGAPLVFQIRLPDGIELVDVLSLAKRARGAPAVVAQGAAELEQVAGPAGVVVIGALRPAAGPEPDREILATLTVAFSEIKGPLSAEDFRVPDSEQTSRSHQEVLELSDKATLITRVSKESPGEGIEPVLMLLLQYLLETRYGALVMAFSTANQEMMGPRPRKLYDRIVETMFIGEQLPPSRPSG